MYYGMCAVHAPKNNPTGLPISPFHFGDVIVLNKPITMTPHETQWQRFMVEDTGDPNWILSTYFIDLYWGPPEYYSNARNFGINKMNYTQVY